MAGLTSLVLISVLFQVALTGLPFFRKLNDGFDIPVIALGVHGAVRNSNKLRQTINWAIEAGYRHIDTAAIYNNEAVIGQAIYDVISRGVASRFDLFITTKLSNSNHAHDRVIPALKESLRKLNLLYVDLFLIHTPFSIDDSGHLLDIDIMETWRGMEQAKELGLAMSIGVANFNETLIDRIIKYGNIRPAVNQIEVHPSLTELNLVAHNQNLGITVMAHNPLGYLVSRGISKIPPPRIDDPQLKAIAKKYSKTSSQIVLRYLVDRRIIPVPTITTSERLAEYLNIFDFDLTKNDINTINSFNMDKSVFDLAFTSHPIFNRKLNSGFEMPVMALGIHGAVREPEKLRETINSGITAGYRSIDTAAVYNNEKIVGQAVNDIISAGNLSRFDLFITTKLTNYDHGEDNVVPALKESLKKLKLSYVDLFLIHTPFPIDHDGHLLDIDILDTWKGMEEAKELGLALSIGVANFNATLIDRIVKNCTVIPAVNQIEVHPSLTQLELVAHNQKLGITVMAHNPLGFLINRKPRVMIGASIPANLGYTKLKALAKKYNKTTSQIVLRYLVHRQIVPVPTVTTSGKLIEYFKIFDFSLTEYDVVDINKFNKNRSVYHRKR